MYDINLRFAHRRRGTFLCLAKERYPKERRPRIRATAPEPERLLGPARSHAASCREGTVAAIHGSDPSGFSQKAFGLGRAPRGANSSKSHLAVAQRCAVEAAVLLLVATPGLRRLYVDACSPDEAQRNPGQRSPDSTSFHPGYHSPGCGGFLSKTRSRYRNRNHSANGATNVDAQMGVLRLSPYDALVQRLALGKRPAGVACMDAGDSDPRQEAAWEQRGPQSQWLVEGCRAIRGVLSLGHFSLHE